MKEFLKSQEFILALFAAVLIFWVIGLWYDLYFILWWYDIPLHFFAGFLAFLIFRWISAQLNVPENYHANFFFDLVCALGFVALLGVFWEFYEFVSDRYLFHNGFTAFLYVYEDTLSDLLLDLFGGFLGFLLLRD